MTETTEVEVDIGEDLGEPLSPEQAEAQLAGMIASGMILPGSPPKTTDPVKGEVWVWRPDRPEFRSVLVVTQVTRMLVRAKPKAGGRSFWNPICHFVDMARPATSQETESNAR